MFKFFSLSTLELRVKLTMPAAGAIAGLLWSCEKSPQGNFNEYALLFNKEGQYAMMRKENGNELVVNS